jgi:hypothetical protein
MLSMDVVAATGLTYRRLDYLTRNGVIADPTLTRGSGSRRQWDERTVVRLALANHLSQQLPHQNPNRSVFPDIATAILDPAVPDPPRRGYALVAPPNTVAWAPTWAAVQAELVAHGAVLLTMFDLDVLLGEYVDLDALYTTP